MTEREHIARYLQGKLAGNELVKFNLRQARDEAFRKEVETERLLHESILKDKQQFEAAGDKRTASAGVNKWWFFMALLFVACISFYFYQNATSPANSIETDSGPSEEKAKEELPEPLDTEEIKTDDRKEKPASPEEQTEPVKTIPPTKKEDPKQPRVFASNFTVNPLLEEVINNTGVRGNGLRLNLKEPAPAAKLPLSEQSVLLRFTGTATSNMEDSPVRLLFFSNKKADYEQWKPIFESAIVLQPENDGFIFSFEKETELGPGLYYYIFEDVNEERYLLAGKLEIGN
ncbi:MAG: hypothetical protein AAFZ15_31350 [Bacteroidota bacterium]